MGESVAAADVPVPDSDAVWGDVESLSAMLSDPVRVPEAVGLNVTVIVQLAAGATDVQLFAVIVKSPALAPASVAALTVRLALPVFDTVTV